MKKINILFLSFGKAALKLVKEFKLIEHERYNTHIVTYNEHKDNQCFKTYLIEKNLLFETKSLKDTNFLQRLINKNFDLIVSIHYRDKIPESLIKSTKYGGINLHPSLLPMYRGCLSTMWVLINNEKETGITYHYLEKNYDTGNIILQKKFKISKEDTGYSIYNRCINLGCDYFYKALSLVIDDKYQGKPQQGNGSYYSREIPYNGFISKEWDQNRVNNFIRAFTFPGKQPAKLKKNNKTININNLKDYLNLGSK